MKDALRSRPWGADRRDEDTLGRRVGKEGSAAWGGCYTPAAGLALMEPWATLTHNPRTRRNSNRTG